MSNSVFSMGTPTPRIVWHNFCQKLHETEKKLDWGVARVPHPLDPPLIWDKIIKEGSQKYSQAVGYWWCSFMQEITWICVQNFSQWMWPHALCLPLIFHPGCVVRYMSVVKRRWKNVVCQWDIPTRKRINMIPNFYMYYDIGLKTYKTKPKLSSRKNM